MRPKVISRNQYSLHSILGSINILMDDTIGLEKQDITFFYEELKHLVND
jgi:hypothetical protein